MHKLPDKYPRIIYAMYPIFSVRTTARILGISKNTVKRYLRLSNIKSIKRKGGYHGHNPPHVDFGESFTT